MGSVASPGIHHVTALSTDPARTRAFYAEVLGLQLVKRTVNFDAPTIHHLYFGDDEGRPGTLLTFFPLPGGRRGRHGVGQATAVALAVPPGSLGFWRQRLEAHGLAVEAPGERFGLPSLGLLDADGLKLELVEAPEAGAVRQVGPLPAEHAVRGIHAVTLTVAEAAPTRELLTDLLGFGAPVREGERLRLQAPGGERGGSGRRVDLLVRPDAPPGRGGAGTVHHLAFRAPDDAAQEALGSRLAARNLRPTRVLDRVYFRSLYFREPGGVLFEIATDPPGFTVDEPAESLGGALRLPPWLEPERERIEAALPTLAARAERV